jgi:serine/threonine protein phosphatase PrpC
VTHPPRWIGIGRTDIGCVRSTNQDTYAVLNDQGVWFVADGMGGHAGGEIAAQTAVSVAITQTKERAALLRDHLDQAPTILSDIITRANQAIHDRVRHEPGLKGMGTTIVALAILPSPTPVAHVAHLGDSRAYLYRDGSLTQLTRDHTLVEQLLKRGVIDAESARTYPERHVLIKGLGMGISMKPELTSCPLRQDDLMLLCTDGLNKMLDDPAIAMVLAECHGDPDRASYDLITQAVERGGEDNVTVVVCAPVMHTLSSP